MTVNTLEALIVICFAAIILLFGIAIGVRFDTHIPYGEGITEGYANCIEMVFPPALQEEIQ